MADLHPPPDPPSNGVTPEILLPSSASKRQRRPSVRLGDIGQQPAAIPYEPFVRRNNPWKTSSKDSSSAAGKAPSKTLLLTNFSPDYPAFSSAEDRALLPVDENLEPLAISIRRGNRDGKMRRGRRVRSSWTSMTEEAMDGADLKSSGGEDAGDDGYREDSDRASDRRDGGRVRVSEAAANVVEGEIPSENDGGDWNEQNGRCRSDVDGGVRAWLNQLGLGRYCLVFEIHEVDEEVLPWLTLEDLKDMGINAVGSRRKMYCAIQKLRKNFT